MNKTLATLLFSLCFMVASIAQKKALVIAIGDYPDAGLWPDISSTNDISHVTGALKTIGFKDADIALLKNEEATREGILLALAKLENSLSKDDFVYIHYSGHGQQVADDNGDELDKLDEAIVPYDSPVEYEKGVYEGQNLIRDEELGAITAEMRNKIGSNGQLFLILDSCHSGSGTRGMGKARGTDKIMASKNFKTSSVKGEAMGIISNLNENAGPMVSFFGASSSELNYETVDHQGKPVGSLSYAISSVLANMKQNYSYVDLYERVKLKMKSLAPNQNPQWEGPKDLYLLGGDNIDSDILYTLRDIKGNEGYSSIGTLNEIYEGTVVELHSSNSGKVVMQGEVVLSHLTECLIEFDNDITQTDDDLLKIKIVERTSPPLSCNIQWTLPEESKWKSLLEETKSNPTIKTVDSNADLYITEENGKISLRTSDGRELYTAAFSEARTKRKIYQLNNHIRQYTQGKFLRSFENESSPLNLSVDIIEVDCKNASKETGTINEGQVAVGSCIKLKVNNNGSQPAYFSLIDIQPDNLVNLVIPATALGYTAEEYYLKPGESYETDYTITIGEPYGNELFKLISSDKPLDLSGIINNQGSTRGIANKHSFEKLFASSFGGTETRGAKVQKPAAEEVGTKNVYFEIIKSN